MTSKEFTYREDLITPEDEHEQHHAAAIEVRNSEVCFEIHDTDGRLRWLYLSEAQFAKAVGIVGRARIARLVATGDPASTETETPSA